MKTLIVYGSKYGFTEECAMKLKSQMGKDTQCINVKKEKVQGIESYNRILIGSPVYAGTFQKEIKAFCEEYLQILLKKEVGIFGSGGSVSEFRKVVEQNIPKELFVHATAISCLGGEFRLSKMNFFERAMIKMISKAQVKKGGEVEEVKGFLQNNFNTFVKKFSR